MLRRYSRYVWTVLMVMVAGVTTTVWYTVRLTPTAREEYEALLRDHPYRELLIESYESGEEERGDRPDLGRMQDFLRTMDPALGRPAPERIIATQATTARLRDLSKSNAGIARTLSQTLAESTVWQERGPSNIGGRTRALLFDPGDATHKKVWAGGVAGGLWFTTDITNANVGWQKVDDFWDNLAISCIAADPTNPSVIYVGTGEGWFNVDMVHGAGLWKSSDGGLTWTRLPSTSEFRFVNDVIVRNESGTGVVYAAVKGGFDHNGATASSNGLFRSVNGGTSWTQVLPSTIDSQFATDIELTASNSLMVGAQSRTASPSVIYSSSNGTTWTAKNIGFTGRVEIATAPSNGQVAYAIVEENAVVGGLFKTTDAGGSWVAINAPVDADTDIPASDFSRSQAWYDLILAVHPTNDQLVYVGTIDLFKSADGGTSWSQISKWHAGIASASSVVHADQHAIAFRPGVPNDAVFGNDGGVYYGTSLATSPSIVSRNNGYNVTQFYTAAIHPTQTNFLLAGAQDNGTLKFSQAAIGTATEAFGGDGGRCFIDQKNPSIQIVSYTNNNLYLSTDGGTTFFTPLLEDFSTGSFINAGAYDSNQKSLFTARDENSIYRFKNVHLAGRSVDQLSIALGSMATAFTVSPHITTQTNLFVGTEAGRLFKITNAMAATPTISEITGTGFPTGSVSSIAIGDSENQLLVTFSNYGVDNIWESRNGGGSWQSKDGDLPDMPVRWAEYHPINANQVYLATEVGVWSTEDVSGVSPSWLSTNGGLANVRTDMLQIRKSDYVMIAATHGRGVFTALIPTALDQTITFNALAEKTYNDPTFDVSATSSSGLTVTFSSSNPSVATISGETITIVGAGTTDISANQSGNVQYKPAPTVVQRLTVNKADQVITFGALTQKSINDQPFTVSATASSSLPVSFSSANPAVATISGNLVTITGVGTSVITASQPGNANYNTAVSVARELTVVSRIIELDGDLSFGDVIIGESKSLPFTIKNLGTAPLNVSGISYPSGYSGTSQVNGNTIVVTVTLAPTDLLDYNGTITVASDATSGLNSISVSGTGVSITGDQSRQVEPIVLYPNPAVDYVEIRGDEMGSVTVLQLVDVAGRSHELPTQRVSQHIARMNITSLAPGDYLVTIPTKEGSQIKRFKKAI